MGASNTFCYPPALATPASGSSGNFDPAADITFTGQDQFTENVLIPLAQTLPNQAASVQTVTDAINAALAAAGLLTVYKILTAAAPLDFTANFYRLQPTAPTTYTFISMDSTIRTFWVKNESPHDVTIEVTGGLVDGQNSIVIPGSTSGPFFGYNFKSEVNNLNTF